MMGKYTITTLGCKVNQSESDALVRLLHQMGWVSASNDDTIDICIINTCTVTAKASMQSRQATRKAIRSHPGARIVVTGCYAQTEPDVLRNISGVNDIIGLADKNRIPDILSGTSIRSSPGLNLKEDNQCPHVVPLKENLMGTRTRPFIKIQDGCNGVCTYCIVPSARGKSQSVSPGSVMGQIQQFAREGYNEVVLTGIHLGHYGLDLTPPTRLSALLAHIQETEIIHRIRFSSIEPGELAEEIIHRVADSECFCRHFHIPLQSGDDRTLKRMRRPYDRTLFRDVILKIRKWVPDAAIGTDVLIGFPGETDAAFENTYELIKELPISYLHVFPFSPREGTPASDYPDQVAWETIQERSKKIRELGHFKKKAFYQQFQNKRVEMIVEGKVPGSPGFMKGTTSNYIPVLIRGEGYLKGSLLEVRIDKVDDANTVTGSIF